ncbi:MAG: ferritin-like domain-containing protein [Myxococcales bacterium]|nr:ferritin-like domain-containing protein [Myxococcales bacterium]
MAWKREDWRANQTVHRVIAAVMAATPMACSSSTADCSNGPANFEIDRALTVEDMVGLLSAKPAVKGWEDVQCDDVCAYLGGGFGGQELKTCDLSLPATDTDGNQVNPGSIKCSGTQPVICEGRRPLGHVEMAEGDQSVGAVLAQMAYLEAAAVDAFEQLAEQLRGFGAPNQLIQRCLLAADDERRHASVIGAHATGHAIPSPLATAAPTDLFSVALHNAVEGCVNEAWAALMAHERSRRLDDPQLRADFAVIAADETRHAQLAWDLHAWFVAQLPTTEAAVVHDAQSTALRRLPQLAVAQAGRVAEMAVLPRSIARAAARDFAARLAA